MLADTAKLIVDLSLKGNFASALSANQRALKSFDSAVSASATRSYRAGQQIGNGIKNLAKVTIATIGTGAGLIGASLKLAGDFEAQLNTINTIAHNTPTQLKAVGDQLRDISKRTGTSLDDLTQAYYDLLSAGVKTADAQQVLNDAVTLGIGGLATTAQTVDLLTTAYNAYGLNAQGAAKATDQFAQAIQDGKVTADQIAGSFANVASIAKTYKIGIDQIAASYATLTAQGVPAGEVTTEMQRAIISLIAPGADLAKVGKALHVNFTKELANKGLVGTLQEIRTYADKNGIPLQTLLGRVEAVKYALATTGPNFAGFNAELAKMGKASGVAAAQMAEREQGLNFQLGRLKALAKDAGITIGSALLPKITPLVEKLNELIQGHQGDIAKFGDSLAGLFTKGNIDKAASTLTDLFKTVKEVAPSLLAGAQITGKVVQAAVDAFKSLPPELQKLAITALAINKLTGGLVTNVAGGIVGAILGQLKSAIVNVTGAVVNVNGGVGIPGGGGVPIPGAPAAAEGGVSGFLKQLPLIGAALAVSTSLAPDLQRADDRLHQHLGIGQPVPVTVTNAGTANAGAIFDKGDREAFKQVTLGIGKAADDLLSLKDLNKGITAAFRSGLFDLWAAKTPQDTLRATKALEQILLANGRGSVSQTKATIRALEYQLKHTHDPETARALRAALHDVREKIPGREYAAKEIARMQDILHSTKPLDQQIKGLQKIENDLKDHKLPGQTRAVQAKIDELKRRLATTTAQTTQAIKDKDLSVALNVGAVSLTTTLDSKTIGRTVVRARKVYSTYS